MMIEPRYYSTGEFHYDASNKEFYGDASDLTGTTRGLFGRVWADSLDEGLVLVSRRTHREVLFVISETQYNDGDLVSWTLRPTRADIMKIPSLEGTSITIFND